MEISRRHWFVACCLLVALAAFPARAHEGYESTSVARLQHNRLELVVTTTGQMGAALAGESSGPDSAPEVNADNLEVYRERLQLNAARLYEVRAADDALTPQRVAVNLVDQGHVQLTLIYPEPKAWPLRFRVRAAGNVPSNFISSLEVFDQDEKLLGGKRMMPRDSAAAELSIDPTALPPQPSPVPAPTPTLVAVQAATPPAALLPPPAQPRAWLEIAVGIGLALFTLLAAFFFIRRRSHGK